MLDQALREVILRLYEKRHSVRKIARPWEVSRTAMSYIENNFLAGRRFEDFSDINQQARQFCHQSNAKIKRHLGASPKELFAREQPQLQPLPLYIPEVYQLHNRIVDAEGYVGVRNHRYSVPYTLIGRRLEVRETHERVDLFDGARLVASHAKAQASSPHNASLAPNIGHPGQRAVRQSNSLLGENP